MATNWGRELLGRWLILFVAEAVQFFLRDRHKSSGEVQEPLARARLRRFVLHRRIGCHASTVRPVSATDYAPRDWLQKDHGGVASYV